MKSGILGAHLDRRAIGGHRRGELVVPDVAALMHGDIAAGAADDENLLVAERLGEGRVGVVLERHLLAAAHALVGGDDQLRAAVVDAAGEAVGREAAEDDGVDGADAGAGEHRDRGFRDHRQVDGDAVASRDAEALQDIGEAADLAHEARDR